jgi:hypothetical protein
MESLVVDDNLIDKAISMEIRPETPEEELARLLRMGKENATSATKIRIPDFDYDARVRELKATLHGGWVYIARNESHPDYYKIGMSKHHPDKRMKSLSNSTSVPTPYELIYAYKDLDYLEIEKELKAKHFFERKKEHYPKETITFDYAFLFINEFTLMEDPVEEIIHEEFREKVKNLKDQINLKRLGKDRQQFIREKEHIQRCLSFIREEINELFESFEKMERLSKKLLT